MKLIGIIGIIGLSLLTLLIIVILFLLWQKRTFRGPATPPSSQGTQPTQPQPSKYWQWNKTVVTSILGSILLIGLIVVVFPNEAKKLLDDSWVIAAIVISIAILAIRWKWWASTAALITLLILLTANVFWPAAIEKFPRLKTIGNDSGKQSQLSRKISSSPSSATLPHNAVLKKTLAPEEIAYLTRERMDLAPPERWTKDSVSGNVVPENAWPPNAKHRGIRNNTENPIRLYVVLTPGQNISVSAIDPALKVAQTSTASDCLLDRAFGPE